MLVDVAIDVGENTGHYALEVRANGFRGTIISFEPQPDAFVELSRHAQGDANWQVHSAAVGAAPTRLPMHIAANSVSYSLLPVGDAHLAAAPAGRTVGTIEVDTATLESLLA